jgi:hypothetical protein
MDKQIASVLLDAFLNQLRKRSYAELCARIRDPQCKEVSAPDGRAYQIEWEAHWDHPKNTGGDLRVIVSIDDGTLRAALRPITRSFIIAPDGSLVGE